MQLPSLGELQSSRVRFSVRLVNGRNDHGDFYFRVKAWKFFKTDYKKSHVDWKMKARSVYSNDVSEEFTREHDVQILSGHIGPSYQRLRYTKYRILIECLTNALIRRLIRKMISISSPSRTFISSLSTFFEFF